MLALLFGLVEDLDERVDLLEKARLGVLEAVAQAEADPMRPGYHFRPAARWMNDPNGPIFHNGWHHMFYQHNPYGNGWGHMHWGHARSRDLVNWEHLPIAIWPTKSQQEDHIYSGSTFILNSGKPGIFYTSISDSRPPEQWIANPVDNDLIEWAKPAANPIVSTQTHAPTVIDEWRDPFLVNLRGSTYMFCGGRHQGKGAVSAYRAKNEALTEWEFVDVVFHHPNIDLIECPNLVQIGKRWVLFTSEAGRIEAFVGHLDSRTLKFTADHSQIVADGSYASQWMKDGQGRNIFFSWINTEHSNRGHGFGWNGVLSLPTEITLNSQNEVIHQPLPEFEQLRGSKTELKDLAVVGELDLSSKISGDMLELQLEIEAGNAQSVEIQLRKTADRHHSLTWDVQNSVIKSTGRPDAKIKPGKTLKLRLFLDRMVLNVFAQDGELFQSMAIDRQLTGVGFGMATQGGEAKVKVLRVWKMKPATFIGKK